MACHILGLWEVTCFEVMFLYLGAVVITAFLQSWGVLNGGVCGAPGS